MSLAWQPQIDFEKARDKISKFHKQYFDKPIILSELTIDENFV